MATPTIPLSDFERLVQPHTPEAPVTLVGQVLRLAAIEFSERTKAWRQLVTIQLTRQGRFIVSPPYASIIEFEHATFDDSVALTPTQYTDFDISEFGEIGVPRYITQVGPDEVSVVPFQEGKLTLSCFLRPRNESEYELDAAGIPRDIFDTVPAFYLTQYGEIIASGALHRLFIMPRQPWTDGALAQYHLVRFDEGIKRHASSHMKGQVAAKARVKPQFF
ncbi:hypothetical protein [Sagittula salina]|uniref:Uncharacterized protein n=1 Tax=Sagittula salina TaxID=2820268 RepID=A0A940MTC1_9RHOB|nr:hypothetical protein [Sagittula salina]MBP0484672.1 hypothetical protein [Sagittula salina]